MEGKEGEARGEKGGRRQGRGEMWGKEERRVKEMKDKGGSGGE